ncbi:sensor histidine kinase [Telmatobacter bradus]|uniref:sensor histidine kinase n=1 Tax=Telmatobacter bradus TaxID=474953 RepID=UPI003B429166
MGSDRYTHRRKTSAVRRVYMNCALLALPALSIGAVELYLRRVSWPTAVLLFLCLGLYLLFVSLALTDSLIRPLQTLANVVASMREGDFSFRARGAGVQDALGELALEVNALADLLQRQRVRSLEATALLARILEVMHTPLFAFDRENRLQLVNHAGLRLLGLSQDRCFGRSAEDVGLSQLLQAPDQSLHTQAVRGVAVNGVTRWLLRKATFRQEGAPHTLLLLIDVSLPLQEEERTAWKRLIRVLGHEISNSLAPIKSIAGSLRMRLDVLSAEESVTRDFYRGLGVVESRADSLHRFVQSYRQLAQLPPPQLRPIELPALLERVAVLEQRLVVKLEQGCAAVVNADPDQLEQLFINLLANAVDASEENGTASVSMRWKCSAQDVTVSIEDQGPGIANADNLFVPFYTTKPTGSGVGLALAQQIARTHGGEIQLKNRVEGLGVCASVRLPLCLAKEEQRQG